MLYMTGPMPTPELQFISRVVDKKVIGANYRN